MGIVQRRERVAFYDRIEAVFCRTLVGFSKLSAVHLTHSTFIYPLLPISSPEQRSSAPRGAPEPFPDGHTTNTHGNVSDET